MLESRSYYHPFDENPRPSKGWSARVVYKGDYGVNRGCNGFKTKKEAEKYLKEHIELWKAGKVGFIGYEIEIAEVVKIV
jgi:hypothetical protein